MGGWVGGWGGGWVEGGWPVVAIPVVIHFAADVLVAGEGWDLKGQIYNVTSPPLKFEQATNLNEYS